MNPNIKAGAICTVIGGILKLNLGKIVVVKSLKGEHSKLGRIWSCCAVSGSLTTEWGAVVESADFASDWLQPHDELNTQAATRQQQLTID